MGNVMSDEKFRKRHQPRAEMSTTWKVARPAMRVTGKRIPRDANINLENVKDDL
ncbi:MAG: hypothetical protein RLZZ224_1675 [Verrucomicrobiota bacterium]